MFAIILAKNGMMMVFAGSNVRYSNKFSQHYKNTTLKTQNINFDRLGKMKKIFSYFGFFLIFFGSFKIITWISRGDLDGALRDSGIFFTGLAIIIIWFFLKGYKK